MKRFIDGGKFTGIDGGRRSPTTGGGGITDKPQGFFPTINGNDAIEPEGGSPSIAVSF